MEKIKIRINKNQKINLEKVNIIEIIINHLDKSISFKYCNKEEFQNAKPKWNEKYIYMKEESERKVENEDWRTLKPLLQFSDDEYIVKLKFFDEKHFNMNYPNYEKKFRKKTLVYAIIETR